ncbi:MAG: ATPase, partial [Thermobispora bispora]|nr:ATPase [Thermobispora bispora]
PLPLGSPSTPGPSVRGCAGAPPAANGDRFDEAAARDLADLFGWVCREGLIDGLGNGRFVRSIYERAAMRRDVRLAAKGTADDAELTTITSEDVRAAIDELS